uniref:Restriction endonuclease type IV Mrr domain-containing protein n=1 Tax=Geoglobus ahangari TaxID=113653 RepID=A0A7C3YF57_9EURY
MSSSAEGFTAVELSSAEIERPAALQSPAEIGRALEDAVRTVFESMGFNAFVRHRLKGKSGAEREIDVYAEKQIGTDVFRIGVECKNWKQSVDRSTLDRYLASWLDCGFNMFIVIAKDFSEEAKKFAKTKRVYDRNSTASAGCNTYRDLRAEKPVPGKASQDRG